MQLLNQIIFESIQEFSTKTEAVEISIQIDNQKTISRKRRGTMTTNQIMLRASIDHAYKRDRSAVLNTVSFDYDLDFDLACFKNVVKMDSEINSSKYKHRSCLKFNKRTEMLET